MDRIREFLIWMKPHRIVKQVCRLNVHFNYSVDRSYMEMQQYTETLHSRMNQLQDERDDLLLSLIHISMLVETTTFLVLSPAGAKANCCWAGGREEKR